LILSLLLLLSGRLPAAVLALSLGARALRRTEPQQSLAAILPVLGTAELMDERPAARLVLALPRRLSAHNEIEDLVTGG
jgi:hypothetical protein